MTPTYTPPKSIAIIGGGLGGLCLAQALHSTGLSVTVYERDSAPSARGQGYAIGINADGYKALIAACPSLLTKHDIFDDCPVRTVSLTDPRLDVLVKFGTNVSGKKEDEELGGTVNRVLLREGLTEGLLQNQQGDGQNAGIVYGKRFLEYEVTDDGTKVVGQFDDGTTTGKVDILVGADGGHSPVRKRLYPQIKYEALGVLNIAGALPLADITGWDDPECKLRRAVLDGENKSSLVRALDRNGGSMLFIRSRDPATLEPILAWVVTRKPGQDEMAELTQRMLDPTTSTIKVKQILHDYCLSITTRHNYHPSIVALLRATPATGMLASSSHDPESLQSRSTRIPGDLPTPPTRIVLLGDAAHATTTHGGLGANTAFRDAIELADAIKKVLKDGGDVPVAMGAYHAKMFARGKEVIAFSVRGTGMNTMGGFRAWLRDGIMRIVAAVIWVRRLVKGVPG
ncbi:uncharacterized protein EV422DRAFT_535799 [Fimicolochytrium jonesii]|uniref:uncharacterized protein n=1 Tax=Fimicolochytrium jonesii TaxID=1396493 RepID=UPI0022FECDB5|nr:uncharacterized protein EV422DRAFT_535799 [Fimicolochytrium jonesii]KAI8818883.1 hypothetical protein EV422DRAFT_535799 [Fimicolochytrium jonesii]